MTRSGRIGAVTNLRGVSKPDAPSRGILVRDYVTSNDDPAAYARNIHKEDFAGFHLIAGEIGGTFVHLADELRTWKGGIHGVSNGAADARWEKIDRAVDHLRDAIAIDDPLMLAHDLIAFLGIATSNEIERTVFVATPRYGTRSSTAIVATEEEVVFAEQSYRAGGVPDSTLQIFRIIR